MSKLITDRFIVKMTKRQEAFEKKFEARIIELENRNRDDLKDVMIRAMDIYLGGGVEFSLSTEGQIKELMNGK